jgi:hypothetical protein
MNGVARVADSAADISTIVHGTTVGTNALLERKVARTGIITTRGFRDVLEMRRRDRPETWGLRGSFTPVVPRDLRREVEERVLADGTLHTAVDLDAGARRSALAARSRLRGRVRVLHQHLREPRERAPGRRGGARALAQPARHLGQRSAARDPRVRALLDRHAERRAAAGGGQLSRAGSNPTCAARASRANCWWCRATAA